MGGTMHAANGKAAGRILVLDSIAESGLSILRGAGFEVGRDINDPTAILVRSTKVAPEEYPHAAAIARAGAGTDNIKDIPSLTARGVPVFFAPGQNAQSVKELVFAALGAYVRKLGDSFAFRSALKIDALDEKNFKELLGTEKKKRVGSELHGKRLGVIGLGNIGRLVGNGGVKRGMQVVGSDPALKTLDDRFEAGLELLADMHEVLARADIVTLHVPYVQGTKPIIGEQELVMMPEGAILINYARGELVDEDALLKRLEEGKLRGYLTDFPSLKTVLHPKVQWTEHLGASTVESEERCAVTVAQSLVDYLRFGVVRSAVNFPDLKAYPRQEIKMRLAIPHRNVPGQLKIIMDVLAAAGANIGPQHNDVRGDLGYCIVDLEEPIPEGKLEEIKKGHENIIAVRAFRF